MMYVGMSNPTAGEMVCAEEFKFHLGLHDSPNDYMFDWHSRTKFESTYIGHSFVARLASNPDIVVDSYTVQPTIVRDCPKRNKAATKEKPKNDIALDVMPSVTQNATEDLLSSIILVGTNSIIM